jgi:hypothetical protein
VVPSASAAELTTSEARAIAKEAYVYGFPIVDSYRIQHAYFVDTKSTEYKAPWNQISSTARVYTPEDKAVQTPNSDTPYSMLGMDLRAEPIVLTVPLIEKGRYYSVQLIDAFTHNFDYIGSRATGNDGGSFVIAGPGWKGETPKGVVEVIPCETELALAVYRTQLFDPGDIENVKQVQAGYKVQGLSAFLGQPAPKPAPALEFPPPLTPATERTSPEFFAVMDFLLRHCPTHPSETAVRERFAKMGVGGGAPFDASKLSPELKKAVQDGMADAWSDFETARKKLDSGEITSGEIFGTRAELKNNYLYRMLAAVLGIYGNTKQEALYPSYAIDADGQKLDGSKGAYTIRFAPGQLPPVNAFWSVTMYEMPQSLLYANPLKRYLINSPMLSSLKKDADGGLTIRVGHESPGRDLESNWLPAPNGPFAMAMRLYWPKPEALDGTWKAPKAQRAK